MKKGNLLIVFTALLCFFSVKKAEAQITGVDLDPSYYFLDSVDRTCVPAALTYYYGGTVTGTLTSVDSLDCFSITETGLQLRIKSVLVPPKPSMFGEVHGELMFTLQPAPTLLR